MKKLLYFVTEDHYFCSHRLELAKAALKEGFQVFCVTNINQHQSVIEKEGIKVIPISLIRKSTNPFKELSTLNALIKIYKETRPDIVHHVALKPILYGTIASLFLTSKPKVVNAFTGMGYLFTSTKPHIRLIKNVLLSIFRNLFRRSKAEIIIQNADDYQFFVKEKLAPSDRLHLVRGSGVSLEEYPFLAEPGPPIIGLCVARMLKDKGIVELVEAAKLLKKNRIPVEIWLVGAPDKHNPSSLTEEELKSWHDQKIIKWLGHRKDIASLYRQSHIAILPSYREGLPKSLLEAAASGKPIVATDVPGCREICIPNLNGLLVPAKESKPLSDAITLLASNENLRRKIGQESRRLAEAHFSLNTVLTETLKIYKK